VLSPYAKSTLKRAVAAFGDPASAEYFCDRQFAVVRGTRLCFATTGDPKSGTKLLTPSTVSWRPARLDYHPERQIPWLPAPLTRCVERNGGYLPLHHMFLRAAGDRQFVYAGIAELPMFGEIPDGGQVQHSARFHLDAKLPRDLWVRLGGYPGWMVEFNGTRQPFAADDVAGFERFLAGVPTASGFWEVSLAGYAENWFTVRFNAGRAWLRFVADAERAVRTQGMDCPALESSDPTCPTPRKREHFGDEGYDRVTRPAGRTVPRELGVRAAVEYFRTGRLPQCIRWRTTRLYG
jgi:hypothetical protein